VVHEQVSIVVDFLVVREMIVADLLVAIGTCQSS